jgi:hypothetical protein
LSFLPPICSSFILIQTLFYYYRYQSYRRQELQANLEIARSTSRNFESFVQDILHQEISIGTAITSCHPMTMPDVTRLLEKSCTSNAAIRDFSWVDGEGFFVYSSNPALVGANNRDTAYFQNVAEGREWTVGELVLARTTAKPVFGITVDSTPGIGTVFRIYLPVAAVHQPETAEERQEPPETHQPASVMQEQLKT